MKLSIIIPYYNAREYIDELLRILAPQVNDETEVILIDDGSDEPFESGYEWLKVYRQKNKGGAAAKNAGMNKAKGSYISFVDADDMLSERFVENLIRKIDETHADVIDFSWRSFSGEGTQHNHKLRDDNDRLKNPSVCTRAFKKSFIGKIRMNEKKDATYDEDFSRKVGYLDPEGGFSHASITEYMYFYRTSLEDSSIHRFKKGLKNTKRIVYYYKHVSEDMTWLLYEIMKEDEQNEVWLLTEKNDIPELRRYCQISSPKRIWAHVLRGEKFDKCEIIAQPIRTQVVLFCEYANKIGGIATFVYNFCQNMKEYYDILFVYKDFGDEQLKRLQRIVPCRKLDNTSIICDTVIFNRLNEVIPRNISYKKSIQVAHCCRQKIMKIPKDRDVLVNVSEAAKASWGEDSENGIVINNLAYNDTADTLLIVSATRMALAADKGENVARMRKLAEMMNDKNIPFVWLNFSDKPMQDPPRGFINMEPRLDIQAFIRKADYLVQLSDIEAYCYATLEALTNNTAVLCTPVTSFIEQGVVDGENGYIIPFDMDFDVTRLLNVPKFNFRYDNQSRIKQWRKILGNTKPLKNYEPESEIRVSVLRSFTDKYTDIRYKKGDQAAFSQARINEILAKGEYIRVID